MTPACPSVRITSNRLLYEPTRYPDIKDPSPVYDGERWHLFGTGCGLPTGLEVLHSTAPALAGPWREEKPIVLVGVDDILHPAAPGVTFGDGLFHMFLQHDFNQLGRGIEYLVSDDGGRTFVREGTALASDPAVGEAGVYDPDPAEIAGGRYLVYAAMEKVGEPDLYLAVSASGSWAGPWERRGRVLSHEDVACHNQVGSPDYEWGLEGPHLLELPGGGVLLTAVCFLGEGEPGNRQRLLLAVADDIAGPYRVIGPAVEPSTRAGRGENGHGTAVLGEDGTVHLVFQERRGDGLPWRLRHAVAALSSLALPKSLAS